MSRFKFLVVAAMAASFLVSVPTASVAADATAVANSQCANGQPPSTSKACPGGWIGSILNANNSHYSEDEVVPQRALLNIPSGGTPHTITISYTARKGSAHAHAYDSLATWNHTQDQAQACQGLAASICSGTLSSLQMASDTTNVQPVGAGINPNTSFHQLGAADRQWKMYGATLNSTSSVTHTQPTDNGQDDIASVTVTFTGPTAGGQALLLYGGHLAVSGTASVPRAWGAGASVVNGGPYQIGYTKVDNKNSNGQNNIQASGIQPLAPANFTVEKTASDETAEPGQTITYTVKVTNTGEEAAATSFVDDFADSVDPSAVTSDPTGGTCNEANGQLTCQTSSIAGGGSQTFTYTAAMPETFEGGQGTCAAGSFPVVNTATLANNQEDSVTVCVAAAAAFTIEKTADHETATPGEDVEYTITVTNNGSTSGSTSFEDDFAEGVNPGDVTRTPAGGSCTEADGKISCDTGSIAPGGHQTFTYTAAMPDTFEGDQGTCEDGHFPVVNTAALDGGGDDSVTVCVEAAADFSYEKTANKDTAGPGDEVEYTITVKNTGSTSGSTTFADDYAEGVDPGDVTTDPEGGSCADLAGSLMCETSILAPGDTQTFTYTVTLPKTFEGEQGSCEAGEFPVVNDINVDGETKDSVTVCVAAAPDFAIVKTSDHETAQPGDPVEYTITVSNNGSTSGSTSFDDDFAEGVDPGDVTIDPSGGSCSEADGKISCDTGSIAPGDSQTFTYTANMPGTFEGEQGTCEAGHFPVVNTATLDGGGDDSVTVCVEAAADFSYEKTANKDTAGPGEEVEYTITVKNTGSTSGSTTFVDDYADGVVPGEVTSDPTGGECADTLGTLACETSNLAPGDTQTFTYTATMPETFEGDRGECAEGSYPVVNDVKVDGASMDSVQVCVEAAADFSIEKSADHETASPGDPVEYTITVTNNGSTSGSTSFEDDFAEGVDPGDVTLDPTDGSCTEADGKISCDTGSIAPGDSQTFTYTANMPGTFEGDPGACEAGHFPVVNTATLDGGAHDDATVCVAASADFTYEKSASSASAQPGDDIDYTIVVKNIGSTSGSTTFVDDFEDSIGDSIDPLAVTTDPDGGLCDKVDGTLSCQTSSIAPGDTQTFTYTATMPETFEGESGAGDVCDPGSFPVVNEVKVDGEGSNGPVTVCVEAAPDLVIEKKVSQETADPEDVLTYTITVKNNGTSDGSTSFDDDYQDILDPSLPESDPAGGTCAAGDDPDNETFHCDTGTIPAGGEQTFTYTASVPKTFTGEPGDGCGDGQYPLTNTATLEGETEGPSVTVCVNAAPDLTVTKSADDMTPAAGQTVTYTLSVENNGTAPGSISFVDDFEDILDPSTPASESEGGSCAPVTTEGNETFECTSGTVEAGGVKTFTYTAAMPSTFTGTSGGENCEPGGYPIANSVIIEGSDPQTVTVCVQAAPELSLVKSVETDHDSAGNEFLTYTLEYTNNGPGEATSALINDEIPTGTAFEECSNECSTGGTPNSATWAVGPIAPDGGTGKVTLTVKVTTKDACEVTNVATIQFGLAPPVSSNTVVTAVTPVDDSSGAHANGNAKGAQVITAGLINLPNRLEQPISTASTSQTGPGGPQLDDQSVLTLKVPGNGSILRADALRTTSASVVTPAPSEARQTSTAEVAKVCIVPIAGKCTVEANTIRAVASTRAKGTTASFSSAGSTIQNLKVVGLDTPVDLNQTTKIPLNKAVFGPNSYVAINERTATPDGGSPNAGLNGGKYSADLTVTMIHVKITGVLGLQKAEVIVSQATAHSDFPETLGCGRASNNSVSGHAFVAGLFTGPLLADLLLGHTELAPLGGNETEHIADLKLPGNGAVLSAKVADSSSQGAVSALNATSSTFSEVAGDGASPLCVLRGGTLCVIMARAIRSASQSTANSGGASSSDSGTTLLGLQIGDSPPYKDGVPPPNHTVSLPGIGFIIMNEQVCDGGTQTSTHSCSGASHSGLTVRGLRVVVTVANNLLGLDPGVELILAEAHSDATFS